jgi:hypothetical protein
VGRPNHNPRAMAEQTKVPAARIVLPGALKPVAAVLVVVAIVAVAVFTMTRVGTPTVTTPSIVPTPLVTPNPHLSTPATAQQVFNGLGHAGLKVTAHTASAGDADSPVVRKIFASYLGWPLDVTEFRSTQALADAVTWTAGAPPAKGDPPVTIAGGNILVIWGPMNAGKAPLRLDERQQAGLQPLVSTLDTLLSPLWTRTSEPVTVSETAPPAPAATADASAGAPKKASPAP